MAPIETLRHTTHTWVYQRAVHGKTRYMLDERGQLKLTAMPEANLA